MNTKKKVDAIVKYFYPVPAGIETNMLETYGDITHKGWDVTIHTSNIDYTTGNMLNKVEKIRGMNILRYKLSKFGFFPKLDFAKVNVVALHNFDIFPHFWVLIYSLLMRVIGRKNYALVLTPHGGFNPEWSVFTRMSALIKSFYHYTLGTFLINRATDRVRAVSEWEKQEMIKKGVRNTKIKVISNGIENEAFDKSEKHTSTQVKEKVSKLGDYIIQIGRIYPIKNYETTIRALKLVPKHIKFVIVGPTSSISYKKRLQELCKKLGVEDRVIFFGVIRGIDKFYLIKNAKMMVHMALWESFCNVVHEGISQGLPVVVANNTALPFLVKDGVNGYLVDTKDFKTVAEKINYILENERSKEIIAMKRVNKELGKEHSWSRVAEKMDEFYRQLI